MTRYLMRRMLLMIPVLLGIAMINFGIYSAAPGDPISVMLNPILLEEGPSGYRVTEEYIEAAKERLGLNQPWPTRYIRWLGRIARGDLGKSLISGTPVNDLILKHAGLTLQLNALGLLLGTTVGLGFGLVQALRQYSLLDYVSSLLTFFYVSMPGFFLALLLIFVFALKLKWFPPAGVFTLGVEPALGDRLRHLILPAATLALGNAPVLMRVSRTSMLEVLRQDYVTVARAKGLGERAVILRHAFRNALIPVVTVLGGQIPNLIGGSFIVEQVFLLPGMGTLTIGAVKDRDYTLIMGLVMVTSTLSVVAVLLTDVIYTLVDPRVHYE